MSDAVVRDRLAAGIRSALPEWARYEGYGTYALAAYLYAVVMGTLAAVFHTQAHGTATWVAVALGALAWLFGSYYKGAAKVRLECDHCGARARGNSICPNCGDLTHKGGNE